VLGLISWRISNGPNTQSIAFRDVFGCRQGAYNRGKVLHGYDKMTEVERSIVQSQEGGSDAVCVAVHIRPLVESELAEGCQTCLSVTPGQPQASIFCFNESLGIREQNCPL
jgi:hypothetical protein